MRLSDFVDRASGALRTAAAPGGAEMASAAELLVAAAEPALRLLVLEVAAAVAEEVGDVLGAEVQVRLRGTDADVVVTDAAAAPGSTASAAADDEGVARMTLRLPESMKNAAERAAVARGWSLNGYLIAAVKRALDAGDRPARGTSRLTGYALG